MDDERAADALFHLQRALRELITAARLGLDVLEEIVEQVGGAGQFARPAEAEPFSGAGGDGHRGEGGQDDDSVTPPARVERIRLS